MNECEPPSLEEVAELTPERLTHAIKALEAATFPKEMEHAVRLAIWGLKTLLEAPALLTLYPLALRLRKILRGRAP